MHNWQDVLRIAQYSLLIHLDVFDNTAQSSLCLIGVIWQTQTGLILPLQLLKKNKKKKKQQI